MNSLAELKNNIAKPPITLIYGGEGKGKTTFPSKASNPIYILTEDGLGNLPVKATPLCTTYLEVSSWMQMLIDDEHEYKTVVIDSLDWLEALIWKKVCLDEDKETIEKIGYGAGYKYALRYWEEFLGQVTALRNKGIMVVFICHSHIKTIKDPMHEAYDKHLLKLHALSGAKVAEFCDVILFATEKMFVKKEGEGFSERGRALGDGELVMYTNSNTPAYTAKNRYQLPPELPIEWDAYLAAFKN